MEKNNELKMQEAKEIYNKYRDEVFEKYGIKSFDELQVYTLPEHLAKRAPNIYGLDNSNYMNYQKDQNLNEVYVFDGGKGEAYIFGTENALIQGYIANEKIGGKEDGKITLSNELAEKTAGVIFASDPQKIKEFEENFFHGDGKDLEVLERILEKRGNFAKEINKTKNEIDSTAPDIEVDEKENRVIKNNVSKDEQDIIENEEKNEIGGNDKKDEQKKQQIPEDVAKACKKLGITNIKSYVYGKADEFVDKTDVPNVNRNGEKVLIIRAEDNSKGTDKYYVFQNDKLCVPGNRDEDIDKVARKTTQNSKDGTLMKPIEIDDEEQYVEYSDGQGLVIKERLEESMNLSTKDLEEYQKEIQEELEEYSQSFYNIEQNEFLSDAQKDEMYIQVNNRFNKNNEELAKKFNIDLSDVKAINLETDEKTVEQVNKETDEPEAWEVPGRRIRGE